MNDIIVSYSRSALIAEAEKAHGSEEDMAAIENLNYGDNYIINGKRFILIKDKDNENSNKDV